MPDYSSLGGGIGSAFGPIGAGVGSLAGALIGGIIGGGQKAKGRRILRDNIRPDYEIPSEITNAAATGLPSEQYNQAMKNIQRQQMFALSKAQDRRGGLAALPGVVDSTNTAMGKLDAENAAARQRNQQVLAQYKDKQWDWNKKQKYVDTYNYGMGLVGSGNQNTANALDQGAAGLGYLASGLMGGGRGQRPSSGGGSNGIGGYGLYGSNPNYDYFQP